MNILAACLEVTSGGVNGSYSPANDVSNNVVSQSSWERSSVSSRVSQRVSDSKYGSM
eukprot:Gb_06409 [translate_table: standard]